MTMTTTQFACGACGTVIAAGAHWCLRCGTPIAPPVSSSEPAVPQQLSMSHPLAARTVYTPNLRGLVVASAKQQILAFTINAAIISTASVLISVLTGHWAFGLALAIEIVFGLWAWQTRRGLTFGHAILGLRVVSITEPKAPGNASIARRMSVLAGGFLVAVVGSWVVAASSAWSRSPLQQGWQDLWAHTVVVDLRAMLSPLGQAIPHAPLPQPTAQQQTRQGLDREHRFAVSSAVDINTGLAHQSGFGYRVEADASTAYPDPGEYNPAYYPGTQVPQYTPPAQGYSAPTYDPAYSTSPTQQPHYDPAYSSPGSATPPQSRFIASPTPETWQPTASVSEPAATPSSGPAGPSLYERTTAPKPDTSYGITPTSFTDEDTADVQTTSPWRRPKADKPAPVETEPPTGDQVATDATPPATSPVEPPPSIDTSYPFASQRPEGPTQDQPAFTSTSSVLSGSQPSPSAPTAKHNDSGSGIAATAFNNAPQTQPAATTPENVTGPDNTIDQPVTDAPLLDPSVTDNPLPAVPFGQPITVDNTGKTDLVDAMDVDSVASAGNYDNAVVGESSGTAVVWASAPDAERMISFSDIVLEFDTGEMVDLQARKGVIGRDPRSDDEPGAHLVAVADDQMSVSKNHLAFEVSDDGLWISDQGSTNGTSLITSAGQAVPLTAGREVQVPANATVRIGAREFTMRLRQR